MGRAPNQRWHWTRILAHTEKRERLLALVVPRAEEVAYAQAWKTELPRDQRLHEVRVGPRDGICSCVPNPSQPFLFQPHSSDPFESMPPDWTGLFPPPGLEDILDNPGKTWRRLLRGTHGYSLQGAPLDVSLHPNNPSAALTARARFKNAAWRRWGAGGYRSLGSRRPSWNASSPSVCCESFPPTPFSSDYSPRGQPFEAPPALPFVFMPVPLHLAGSVQSYVDRLQRLQSGAYESQDPTEVLGP